MSIATEITRLQTAKADLKTAIEGKGVTVPSSATLDDYADLVDAIETGGGGVSLDGLADLSEPSGAITLSVASIGNNAFIYRSAITSVSAPNATSIGNSAFSYCTDLESVDFPEATSIGSTEFQYSTALEEVYLPKLRSAGNNGNYTFRNCSNLVGVVLPSYTGSFGQGFFAGCSTLGYIDSTVHSIGGFGAITAPNLDVIVLRHTSVVNLTSTSGFTNTPFGASGTGGTLYVPSDLIASYQSATNWSTILGYANNSIKSIEGSIYKTQYADGTPIPTA